MQATLSASKFQAVPYMLHTISMVHILDNI